MHLVKKIKNLIHQRILATAPHQGFMKKMVVYYYILGLRLSGKYEAKRNNVAGVIRESNRKLKKGTKQYKELYEDVLYCCYIYECLPSEYFTYDFTMLSHKGRSSFVTRGNKYPYYNTFNNSNYAEFLNKKSETCRKFGSFYGREVVPLIDESDFEAFKEFVGRHPKFIYKPVEDHGGNGVKIYDSTQYPDLEKLFKVLIFKGACVVEELIVQGEALAQIHRGSINTVRFVTYRKDNGEIIPQWSFLRMGSGGSITDNMSGGGISAKIDISSGVICDYGRDYKRNSFLCHPDSGVQLIGFKLPEWDRAIAMVTQMASVLPDVKFIGWDLAYTEKGWVMVEGNSKTQCVAHQVTHYGGMLHTYKKMMEVYKQENKRIHKNNNMN